MMSSSAHRRRSSHDDRCCCQRGDRLPSFSEVISERPMLTSSYLPVVDKLKVDTELSPCAQIKCPVQHSPQHHQCKEMMVDVSPSSKSPWDPSPTDALYKTYLNESEMASPTSGGRTGYSVGEYRRRSTQDGRPRTDSTSRPSTRGLDNLLSHDWEELAMLVPLPKSPHRGYPRSQSQSPWTPLRNDSAPETPSPEYGRARMLETKRRESFMQPMPIRLPEPPSGRRSMILPPPWKSQRPCTRETVEGAHALIALGQSESPQSPWGSFAAVDAPAIGPISTVPVDQQPVDAAVGVLPAQAIGTQRKTISSFFGRNKRETKAIPAHLWDYVPRTNYQRFAYSSRSQKHRHHAYADKVADMIDRIHKWWLSEGNEGLQWEIRIAKSRADMLKTLRAGDKVADAHLLILQKWSEYLEQNGGHVTDMSGNTKWLRTTEQCFKCLNELVTLVDEASNSLTAADMAFTKPEEEAVFEAFKDSPELSLVEFLPQILRDEKKKKGTKRKVETEAPSSSAGPSSPDRHVRSRHD